MIAIVLSCNFGDYLTFYLYTKICIEIAKNICYSVPFIVATFAVALAERTLSNGSCLRQATAFDPGRITSFHILWYSWLDEYIYIKKSNLCVEIIEKKLHLQFVMHKFKIVFQG